MNNREKILRYYKSSGQDILAARLLDLAEQALRSRRFRVSDFLDPAGISVAETVAAQWDGKVRLELQGGYERAERVKAAFVSAEYYGAVDFGLRAIAVSWDKRYERLSHRDVLGGLLGVGIEREVLGDILMTSEGCQVLTDAPLGDYLLQQLSYLGGAQVSTKEISLAELEPKEETVKEIKTTVPSLRLDVVAASGYGVSRSRMAEEIKADKLRVNWQPAKGGSQSVQQGDSLSLRGRGRVDIVEILGETKKGRLSLLLRRYL